MRAMSKILDEIAEVKAAKQAKFRELLGPGREVHDGEPTEVRLRVLKAQYDPEMLALDVRLEELRAEQRAHDDHAAQVEEWAAEEERNRALHDERAAAFAAGRQAER